MDKADSKARSIHDEHIRWETDRINARMRHLRGVAISVLNDAKKLMDEILRDCEDSRTETEIIEGISEPAGRMPACGWQEFREKLNLLDHYINYTKKLCEGSIDETSKGESEVTT